MNFKEKNWSSGEQTITFIVIALSFFVQSKFAAGRVQQVCRNCSFLYFLSSLAGLESYSCLLSLNSVPGNHDSLDSRISEDMPNDTPKTNKQLQYFFLENMPLVPGTKSVFILFHII
jgi:hypothetical protein